MNRLQQKCFIAATGIHLLLAVILFVGPAFVSAKKPDESPLLNFVPWKTVDEAVSGGGNPNAQPPPPAPPAPPPPQPAPPVITAPPPPKPEPVKPEPPKIVNKDPIPAEPKPQPPKPRTPQISTTIVERNSNELKAAQDAARAREQEEAKRRAQEISRAISGLKSSLSPTTKIEMQGPGGGGLPYANWLQAVKTRYANAWIVPDSISDDSAVATVAVTIARDGTVLTARIIKPSGNAAVDRSIRRVLDDVKFAVPLPENAREEQRTVNITFDVRAKLLG